MSNEPLPRGVQPLGATPFGSRTVEAFRLDNGLRLVVLPQPRGSVFAWHTWFGVGSRHELPGRTGIAHLFEHMMFKATHRFGDGEFDRAMEARGAQTNAATWLDWTYYHEVLPVSAENLDFVAEVEADRMVNLRVDHGQLTAEREVVLNERRYRVDDDPEGRLGERLSSLLFGAEHPYGWPTIGWLPDIEAISTGDCEDFYKTWYAPNNATVVVAGGVGVHEVVARVAARYGGLSASTLPQRPTPPDLRPSAPRRDELLLPLSADRLHFGWVGPALDTPDNAAIEVAVELLVGGESSRLVRRLVDELELATSVDGFAPQFRYPGPMELFVSAREPGAGEAIEAEIVSGLEALGAEVPLEREVRRAKNQLEASTYRSNYSANAVAGKLGFYDATVGDFSGFQRHIDRVREVTPDDVRRVARTYLDPQRRAVVIGRPDGSAT